MAQQASKPFDIQSPQKIAMEYGGNKQKIAQAMQLGIVDSTAGVLAGMFIDKMRAAQMQEQMPQATIAQQVMGGAQPSPAAGAPPAGGIGASPQGAPPMAPPPPPQGGMPPAPPMGAPPQGAPPMGMADGGLASLPIPDNMFDEPSNGGFDDGYSGGGLVAFAGGGDTFYGYSATDPMANAPRYEQLFGRPEAKYVGEYEQELLQERSPEARKRAKDMDLGYALMAMGAKMASTPGTLLQAASAGIGAGAPILYQSAKERKAEERDIRKGLLDIEAGRNTAAAQRAAGLIQMQQMGIQGQEAAAGRQAQIELENLKQKGDIALENLRQSGRVSLVGMRGSGGGGGGGGESGESGESGGRGTAVTANRASEIRDKYRSAKINFDEARRAWAAMGKPKNNDRNPRRAQVAQAMIDAHGVYQDLENELNASQVRGQSVTAAGNTVATDINGRRIVFRNGQWVYP